MKMGVLTYNVTLSPIDSLHVAIAGFSIDKYEKYVRITRKQGVGILRVNMLGPSYTVSSFQLII